MTAKKQPVKDMDWAKFFNGLASAVILVGMWYMNSTMNQVKKQGDGNLTASKLAIAISAEALAVATKSPKDIKTAEEARAAYEAQVIVQMKSEQ